MSESLTYEKVLELIQKSHNELADAHNKFREELRESRVEFEKRLEMLAIEREREAKQRAIEREQEAKEREREAKQRAIEREQEAIEREREAKQRAIEREREAKEREQEEKEKAKEREKEREKAAKEQEKRNKDFDKKIGRIANTLGYFVEGLVEPKLLELFQNRGIFVTEIYHNVTIHCKETGDGEIDILLANSKYSVAVEVKTTLTVEDVKGHLSRMNKLQKNPNKIVKNSILLGAVAGMRIAQNADTYASRHGLFVLKQKGEIMEIANEDTFQPREWKIE